MSQSTLQNLENDIADTISFWQSFLDELRATSDIREIADMLSPHTDGWGKLVSPYTIESPVGLLEDLLSEENNE